MGAFGADVAGSLFVVVGRVLADPQTVSGAYLYNFCQPTRDLNSRKHEKVRCGMEAAVVVVLVSDLYNLIAFRGRLPETT